MQSLVLSQLLLLAALAQPAEVESVVVTPGDCAALTLHQPAEDVAYKPGVDVNGKAVAPADLEDSGRLDLAADREYQFNLEIPLEKATEIKSTANLDRVRKSDISVGTVVVKDGQVYFDGQPLGSQDAHALAEACRSLQRGKGTE